MRVRKRQHCVYTWPLNEACSFRPRIHMQDTQDIPAEERSKRSEGTGPRGSMHPWRGGGAQRGQPQRRHRNGDTRVDAARVGSVLQEDVPAHQARQAAYLRRRERRLPGRDGEGQAARVPDGRCDDKNRATFLCFHSLSACDKVAQSQGMGCVTTAGACSSGVTAYSRRLCKTASSVQRQDKPFPQLVQQSSQPRQYAFVFLSRQHWAESWP